MTVVEINNMMRVQVDKSVINIVDKTFSGIEITLTAITMMLPAIMIKFNFTQYSIGFDRQISQSHFMLNATITKLKSVA